MKVIELYGLPGSGKSTLSEELSNRLKGENLRIGYKSNIFAKYKNKKKINKIFTNFLLLFYDLRLNFYLILFATQYGLFNRERVKRIRLLMLLNYLLSKESKRSYYDILILDEGFVQFITSIPHEQRISNNSRIIKLTEHISNKNKQSYLIKCEINIDESLKRISNRSTPSPRFDFLPTKDLRRLLDIKKANLYFVGGNMKYKKMSKLNMKNKVNSNVDLILSYFRNDLT